MNKQEIIAKINAIAPLLVTLVGCINAFLTLRGLPNLEIGDETITLVVSGIATIIGEIWGWWRNNNWTQDAQITQPVLNGLKAGTITQQEVNNLVNSSDSN